MLLDVNNHTYQGVVTAPGAYQSLKPKGPINQWVYEFWQLNVPSGQYCYRSVPDNCVDMIFSLSLQEAAFVVAPFVSAKVFEMQGPVRYFGVRFHLFGQQGFVDLPLGEWGNTDSVTNLSDLLPDRLFSELENNVRRIMSFQQRCRYFSEILLNAVQQTKIDNRLLNFILYCNKNMGANIDLSNNKCGEFGLSSRQLRRLTSQNLGLSPSQFFKVIRFQKALGIVNKQTSSCAWAQYYDQAHFNRDFKSMTGITPNQFRSTSVLYNTD